MLSLEDEERAALVETSDRGDSGERFDGALPVPWYSMRNAEAQYNADRSSICMERDFMPLALKDLGNCVEVKGLECSCARINTESYKQNGKP